MKTPAVRPRALVHSRWLAHVMLVSLLAPGACTLEVSKEAQGTDPNQLTDGGSIPNPGAATSSSQSAVTPSQPTPGVGSSVSSNGQDGAGGGPASSSTSPNTGAGGADSASDDAAKGGDTALPDDGLPDDGALPDDGSAGTGEQGSDDTGSSAATDSDDTGFDFPDDFAFPDDGDSSDPSEADDSSTDDSAQSDDSSEADDGTPSLDAGSDDPGGTLEVGRLAGITEAHNRLRAEVDTDDPLPPLEWSDEIAVLAQEWADHLAETCGFEHSMRPGLGENLAEFGTSQRGAEDRAGVEAVEGWYSELSCYEYGTFMDSDSCSSECDDYGGCGHYTQVVWRETERVGCGTATCESDGFYWDIYVCNYDPPGNYIGELPY